MSRIIYRPTSAPKARMRMMVGWRLAAAYPEGTILEDRRGVRWVSWRPRYYAEMDAPPAWMEMLS